MGECRGRRWIAPPHAREDGGIEGRGHGVEEEGHAGRVLAAIAGRGRRTWGASLQKRRRGGGRRSGGRCKGRRSRGGVLAMEVGQEKGVAWDGAEEGARGIEERDCTRASSWQQRGRGRRSQGAMQRKEVAAQRKEIMRGASLRRRRGGRRRLRGAVQRREVARGGAVQRKEIGRGHPRSAVKGNCGGGILAATAGRGKEVAGDGGEEGSRIGKGGWRGEWRRWHANGWMVSEAHQKSGD